VSPATSPASPTPSLRAAPKARPCLAVSDFTAPNNIDPELDKPTPLEEASREDDDDDVYSSIAPPGQEVG
jgi:hypothetical protein